MTTVVEGSRRARSLTDTFSKIERLQNNANNDSQIDQMLSDWLSKLGIDTSPPLPNGGPSLRIEKKKSWTERTYLILITLGLMLNREPASSMFVVVFLTHMILSKELGLSGRHLPPVDFDKIDDQARGRAFLTTFSEQVVVILRSSRWAYIMRLNSIFCDTADIVDGRLFYSILQSPKTFYPAFNADARLSSELSELNEAVMSLSEVKFTWAAPSLEDVSPTATESRRSTSSDAPSILPFSSAIFDKHLTSVKISIAESHNPRPESARIFQEVTHWHNAKRRLDSKAFKELTGKEKGRALRRNQFFMAEMLAYAASLTNASGKSLEPETITLAEAKKPMAKTLEANKENESIAKSLKNPTSKGGSNRKNIGKQAMLSNLAASKAAKEEDVTEKTFKAWETARKIFDSESLPVARYMKAKRYLNDPSAKRKAVEAEVELYKICVLLSILKDLSKGLEKDQRHREYLYGAASMLWDSIRKIASANGLTKVIIESAKQIISTFGLPPVVFPSVGLSRPLTFDPTNFVSNLPKLPLMNNPQDFQLRYCGPYMDRNLDSAPDSRVPFEPE